MLGCVVGVDTCRTRGKRAADCTDPTAEGIWLANISDPNVAYARTYFGVDLAVLQSAFASLDAKPPAATGIYGDVPTDHPAAAWIERLADEDITQGCGANSFCPSQAVTRDQLAVLLSRTLELAL